MARRSRMGRSRARVASVAAVALGVAALALAVLQGGGGYEVRATFVNAGQLVRGNPVQSGGVAIGSVGDIAITDDGRAEVELVLDDEHAPLREGTRAAVRQLSQSGIANRYVDLEMPPFGAPALPDGARIGTDATRTQVDLDQLFDTLDPPTRRALQGFFTGQAAQLRRMGGAANAGLEYLSPALSSTRRLLAELGRDAPVLERFLVDSSRLVTAVAERRPELASLVEDAAATTAALSAEKGALADAVAELPPFMRRANTVFAGLRATLDDLDPLVAASRPAARRLGPFLREARALGRDARPAARTLARTISAPRGPDLIGLLATVPPLASIAVDTERRSVTPGGAPVDVGETRGAFQESAEALRGAAPVIALGRPHTPDFLGWLDDFSTTGGFFDALTSSGRGYISFAENFFGPVRSGQFRRCPGGADLPASDGSNVLSEAQQAALECEESHRAVQLP